MSRTPLQTTALDEDLFHRNQPAARVDQALANLAHDGKAHSTRILTGGRPADLWTATTASR